MVSRLLRKFIKSPGLYHHTDVNVEKVAGLDLLFQNLIEKFKDKKIQELHFSHSGTLSCLEANGQLQTLGVSFRPAEVTELAWKLAWDSNVRLDPYCPFAGGVIRGFNLRWHAVIPPVSPDGPLLVIRRQNFEDLSLNCFEFENFSESDVPHWLRKGFSVVIFGSTGCGKSTLLFSIMKRHFLGHRLGLVESVVELPLISPLWFRLVRVHEDTAGKGAIGFARVTAEMLRMSPQVVVLGEIRGDEVPVWGELARTGHGGVLTTLHAGSAWEAKLRLGSKANIPSERLPPAMGIHVFRGTDGNFRCKMSALDEK